MNESNLLAEQYFRPVKLGTGQGAHQIEGDLKPEKY